MKTILVILALALSAHSDVTIHVGDVTISGSRLTPYENAWLMSAQYPDGRKVDQGVWTDALRAGNVNGRAVMIRTQGLTYLNGLQSMIVNTFDAATLAPISTETRGRAGRVIKRTFAGAHIETRLTPPGGAEQMSAADLPMPVFDFNGGMYGLLFAAQRLKVGLTGELPAVNDVTNTYETVPFAVVRQERIGAGAKGDVDAWVVETGKPVSFRFWIIDRAPYIVKLVGVGQGSDTVWEMIR